MSDSSKYITTIKELMRLTREDKIEWEERPPKHERGFPTFIGTYDEENLEFCLEEESPETTSVADLLSGKDRSRRTLGDMIRQTSSEATENGSSHRDFVLARTLFHASIHP